MASGPETVCGPCVLAIHEEMGDLRCSADHELISRHHGWRVYRGPEGVFAEHCARALGILGPHPEAPFYNLIQRGAP